jgi:hypothetical protein
MCLESSVQMQASATARKPRVLNIGRDEIPSGAVYIGRGRGSRFGNPFVIGRDGTRAEVIRRHKGWFVEQPELMASLTKLRGKDLVCFCAPLACHGDFLLELANADSAQFQALVLGARVRVVPKTMRQHAPDLDRFLRSRGIGYVRAEYSGRDGQGGFGSLRFGVADGCDELVADGNRKLQLKATLVRCCCLDTQTGSTGQAHAAVDSSSHICNS